MNAVILCVGRLKEKWQEEGVREYLTRLSRYGKYEIEAVDDVRDPVKPSEALIRQGVNREGEALMRRVRPNDRLIALCVDGPRPDSPGLSRMMAGWSEGGRRAVLVIGGSNGLSDAVLARADEKLSFGSLTFPHGLMRVVLLEQLYRGEKILAGEKYHK